MKKIAAILLTLALVLSMAACSPNTNTTGSTPAGSTASTGGNNNNNNSNQNHTPSLPTPPTGGGNSGTPEVDPNRSVVGTWNYWAVRVDKETVQTDQTEASTYLVLYADGSYTEYMVDNITKEKFVSASDALSRYTYADGVLTLKGVPGTLQELKDMLGSAANGMTDSEIVGQFTYTMEYKVGFEEEKLCLTYGEGRYTTTAIYAPTK